MKIGILTYHRSHNYGALLQAIGLREYLEGKGHEVYYVDYWPDYHRKMYFPFPSLHTPGLSIRGRISGLLQDIFLFPIRRKRISAFRRFIDRNVIPFCSPICEPFDCIICGSDQIWRKQRGLGGSYNPIYFGGGETVAKRYISYAGSMGNVSISEKDIDTLTGLFSNLQAISVREKSLAETLLATGVVNEAEVVADPTILLGAESWREMISGSASGVNGRYVLYYRLMYDCFDESDIRKFADAHNLRLVILEGNIRREDYLDGSITDADPLEMLRLIAYADFVFTSSYHGLVFSLLFHRQMVCAFKENKDRAISLLSSLGISERMIGKGQPIPTLSIDYEAVGERLDGLAVQSRHWLDANIAGPHISAD